MAAGTTPVEHELTGRVGFNENRVERFTDRGQRMGTRQHGRVHSDDNARVFGVIDFLGDGEQLDHKTHIPRGRHIVSRHIGDPLDVHISQRHPRMEGQLGQDRGLRRGVMAVHIQRRIGFQISEGVGLSENVGVLHTLLVHLGEHEVGGAVDDAHDFADTITSQ